MQEVRIEPNDHENVAHTEREHGKWKEIFKRLTKTLHLAKVRDVSISTL